MVTSGLVGFTKSNRGKFVPLFVMGRIREGPARYGDAITASGPAIAPAAASQRQAACYKYLFLAAFTPEAAAATDRSY
jgi:hypothetical protein